MIEELRMFLAIAELGTFTQGARRVHRTQPAVTAAIRRLERELGGRLFDRGRRGATLTASGRALLPHARAAIRAAEKGARAVAETEGLERGEVRLAAGATAVTYLLPSILARYRNAHPQIRFLLRESPTDEALDALESGDIDIAVISDSDGEPWFTDELVLIAAPDFPDPDPERAPFVAFRPHSTSRRLMDRAFPDARVVMELGSIAAVKGNVRAGIGIALVSRHAITRDLESCSLVCLPHRATPIRRPLELVHHGVERLPPAVSALRDLLLSADGRPT